MIEERKKALDFEAFGIIIGVFVVIISIILVVLVNLSRDDKSGEGITWVG